MNVTKENTITSKYHLDDTEIKCLNDAIEIIQSLRTNGFNYIKDSLMLKPVSLYEDIETGIYIILAMNDKPIASDKTDDICIVADY